MKFRKLTDKEVLELGLPDHCVQVEAWECDNPHISVIKSVDTEFPNEAHVSIMGIPLLEFSRDAEKAVLEVTYGRSDYSSAQVSAGDILHFYFDFDDTEDENNARDRHDNTR